MIAYRAELLFVVGEDVVVKSDMTDPALGHQDADLVRDEAEVALPHSAEKRGRHAEIAFVGAAARGDDTSGAVFLVIAVRQQVARGQRQLIELSAQRRV